MNIRRPLLALFALASMASGHAAQLLVLSKADATLSFFDPVTEKVSATVATGDGPHEVEVSTDGKLAFVSNYGAQTPGSTLSVIDIQAREEIERVELGDLKRPHGLSFVDGHLYFTSELSRKVVRLDPKTRRVDWQFDTEQNGT